MYFFLYRFITNLTKEVLSPLFSDKRNANDPVNIFSLGFFLVYDAYLSNDLKIFVFTDYTLPIYYRFYCPSSILVLVYSLYDALFPSHVPQ